MSWLSGFFFFFFFNQFIIIFSNYATVQYWFSLACLPRKTLEKIFLGFSVTRWNSYEWQLSFLLSVLVGFHSYSVENLCCTVSKCNVVTSESTEKTFSLYSLKMWHVDKLRALYQFSLFLSPYLTVTCRSFIVPYSDGLTELDGYHSGYCTLSRGCVIVSFPIYTSIPEPSIIQPYSLYILKRSKSFAVWWRCVLTQRNYEDGILIGLIELMVLSPLFAEECQGLCWLFASCFCGYTGALSCSIAAFSHYAILSLFFSSHPFPVHLSNPCEIFRQMNEILFDAAAFYTLLSQMSFIHSDTDKIKWLWCTSIYIP